MFAVHLFINSLHFFLHYALISSSALLWMEIIIARFFGFNLWSDSYVIEMIMKSKLQDYSIDISREKYRILKIFNKTFISQLYMKSASYEYNENIIDNIS